MWAKLSFVLSQITHLTDRQTHEQTNVCHCLPCRRWTSGEEASQWTCVTWYDTDMLHYSLRHLRHITQSK